MLRVYVVISQAYNWSTVAHSEQKLIMSLWMKDAQISTLLPTLRYILKPKIFVCASKNAHLQWIIVKCRW